MKDEISQKKEHHSQEWYLEHNCWNCGTSFIESTRLDFYGKDGKFHEFHTNGETMKICPTCGEIKDRTLEKWPDVLEQIGSFKIRQGDGSEQFIIDENQKRRVKESFSWIHLPGYEAEHPLTFKKDRELIYDIPSVLHCMKEGPTSFWIDNLTMCQPPWRNGEEGFQWLCDVVENLKPEDFFATEEEEGTWQDVYRKELFFCGKTREMFVRVYYWPEDLHIGVQFHRGYGV